MDIYSIGSVYLSSLPCNPEACVSQLILSYSKFSSYLSNLSIYFFLVLSKVKPATEEPPCILILSGFLDVQSSNVQLLQVHAVSSLSLFNNFAQKTVEKVFFYLFPLVSFCFQCLHTCAIRWFLVFFPPSVQVLYPLCLLLIVTASFSLLMNVLSSLMQISLAEWLQLHPTYCMDG